MAAFRNFRSALNGFNREDVVHYIEYLNNQHTSERNQMNTEFQALQAELNALRERESNEAALLQQLEYERSVSAGQAQELEKLRAQLAEASAPRPQTDDELEAYRRAERAERLANERVSSLFAQANGILADTTARTDEAVTQISDLAEQVATQLSQLQEVLSAGANTIRDSAAAMYAIQPLNCEE